MIFKSLIAAVAVISPLYAESVYGALVLADATKKDLSIYGAATLTNVTAESLNIYGALTASNLTVSGKTNIFGVITAVNSTFNDLELASDDSVLTNSKTNKINVIADKDTTQKLTLKGTTVISGDVVFESGKGEVHTEKDVVIKGQVKGAVVVKD